MRITTIALAVSLGLAVQVAADPKRKWGSRFCHMTGQGCPRLKRAAGPLPLPNAEALERAEAEAVKSYAAKRDLETDVKDSSICWQPNQACDKLKRAVEEATDELLSIPGYELDESDANAQDVCGAPNKPCHKAKRSAEALAAAIAEAAPFAFPEADPKRRKWGSRFCHMTGQGCPRVKRDGTVEAQSLPAEPPADVEEDSELDPEAEANAVRFCHLPAQECDKINRAAQVIGSALDEAEPSVNGSALCSLPGHDCHKAKTAASALALAALDAVSSIPAPEAEAE
ncbi:methionyl-tRNA synthetase [Coniosporium apollinis]|uniref:Methionyl-tRNA synthetase n=1 Tax=Coniosporium apollinis TaxID=61459 RepID=A0ABQ9P5V4_9PEZI|nr:methionyl-tRNA synthetase [Coniosporium apollinis]